MPIEVDGMPIKYELLPERFRGGVERWIEHGVTPGRFLSAVLNIQLPQAFSSADDKSLASLRDIVIWFYNHAPQGSFGSPETTSRWAEARQKERSAAA